MNRIWDAIRAPGAKGEISEAAPTQEVNVTAHPLGEISGNICTARPGDLVVGHNIHGFVPKAKSRLLDRWLDAAVRFAGSGPVIFSVMSGLLVWIFLAIRDGHSMQWAITISNVQAILSYIFDSLLMRQQLNEYDRDVRAGAFLRSRLHSQKRMLREIFASNRYQFLAADELEQLRLNMGDVKLPIENWLGRLSTYLSAILGNFITIGLFWVGVFVWLGFGHSLGWSVQWQLYINSATSALMLLIFAFLANVHERRSAHINNYLVAIFEIDSAIEVRLRTLTGDITLNPIVTIPAPTISRIQRAIFYYADLVGTLVGIALLITITVAWLAVGPVMSFNSNWWLLIGTYAGLVGMNDAFVLDNTQAKLNSYVDNAFEQVLFDDIYTPEQARTQGQKATINQRLSARMSSICSHPTTVVIGFLSIIGLLIGATAMEWTIIGQLLCNVPPSIIESFFMMVLITSNNMSDDKRRACLQAIYLHRLELSCWVKEVKLQGVE
ncbi:hypothetical protein ACHAPJ_008390 [Fusarium lateritium]